jgi:hypothetical protein
MLYKQSHSIQEQAKYYSVCLNRSVVPWNLSLLQALLLKDREELRNNTTNFMHTSLSLHFIAVQCLDMFRALLAHRQKALYERRTRDYCVQL